MSHGAASDGSYAGDVTVQEAWRILKEHEDAFLVDVRTRAEWNWVGVPALSDIGKEPAFIEWQQFPSGDLNPNFVDAVKAQAPDRDAPVLFLCRSGARSEAAAKALTAAGLTKCFNISDGFEGPPDDQHHRGRLAGWKAAGLPWIQK